MKPLFLLLAFAPLLNPCYGQDNQSINKKLQYSLTAGTGFSYFHYNSSEIKEKFASPEFRMGIMAQRQLTKEFSIYSGLRLGLKLKTSPIYSEDDYVRFPYRSIAQIDKTTSQSDHYFIEIPLRFQYQYKKFGVGAGIVYRNLVQFDNNRYVSYFTTTDVGITPSLSYQLNNRFRIGAEYFFGMIRFFQGEGMSESGNEVDFKAYNRYAQISIEYSLRKK